MSFESEKERKISELLDRIKGKSVHISTFTRQISQSLEQTRRRMQRNIKEAGDLEIAPAFIEQWEKELQNVSTNLSEAINLGEITDIYKKFAKSHGDNIPFPTLVELIRDAKNACKDPADISKHVQAMDYLWHEMNDVINDDREFDEWYTKSELEEIVLGIQPEIMQLICYNIRKEICRTFFGDADAKSLFGEL